MHYRPSFTLQDAIRHASVSRWARQKDALRTHSRAQEVAALIGLDKPLRSVTRQDIARARDILADSKTAATVNRYLAAFASALACAHDDGIFDTEIPRVAALKEGRGRDRIPTRDEIALMLRSLRTLDSSSALEAARLSRLLWRTGMRLSEALGLTSRSVERRGGHLYLLVEGAKNDRDREVPLHPACQAAIRRGWLPEIPVSTYGWAWRKAREAAGLGDWCTPHTLRHARVTALCQAGVPLPLVSAFVGHLSWRTTQRYAHLAAQDNENLIFSAR